MDEDASISALWIQAAKVSLEALHKEHVERVDRAGKVEKADSALEEEEEVGSFGEDKACHRASFSNFYFSLFQFPFLSFLFPFLSTVSTTRHFNPIEDY